MNLAAPAWASRFQITRKLGMGGLGVVYEADDSEREHRVALKKLHVAGSQALFALKREFRVLSGLHHPNLIQLYDLFVDDNEPFFSMELVEGTDLRSYCAAGAPEEVLSPDRTLSPEDAPLASDLARLRKALRQLCQGLQTLHEAGLIHRDIKPANVLVTKSEVVKILDFGLAVEVETVREESAAGQAAGTIAYMSPEQAAGILELSPATDWYSVGAVLYELLTGRIPHEAISLAQLRELQKQPVIPPRQLVASVPADLDSLCCDLLRLEPEHRPLGSEVLERLRAEVKVSGILPSVGRSTTSFGGRDTELAVLREVWARLETTGSQAVLVKGPAGIGKSSLVRQFLSEIETRGESLVVLAGRCYERETVPYRAMDAVIDELSRFWRRLPDVQAGAILPRDAGRLRQLFPVLGRVPAVAGEPEAGTREAPEERRTRGYAALRETFQRLAARRRVVLILDDLQWIDRESSHLLQDLLRQPDPPPLLLVLISRDYPLSDTPALSELVEALDPILEEIALGPLPLDVCHRLARTLAEGAPDQRLANIAAESGGNPFLLAELARFVKLETSVATHSLKLEGLFGRRLTTLSPSARRLLETICVAGDPIPTLVARQASGLEPQDYGESERALYTGHFIRSAGGMREGYLEPYHNRIREIIAGSLSKARLAEIHRSLAIILESSGTATEDEMARHWYGAGELARAAPHFRAAAAEAYAATDFDGAAERIRRVLELGSYDWEEARLLWAQLGDALAHAGRPIEAAEAYDRATSGADRTSLLEYRRRAMEQLLGGGYMAQGLWAAKKLLAEVGLSLPDSRRATLSQVVSNQVRLTFRGLSWTPRPEASVSADALSTATIASTVGNTLSIVDTLRASAIMGTGLRRALDLGEPGLVARSAATASCMASALGQRKKALRLMEVMRGALALADSLVSRAFSEAAGEFMAFFLDNDWSRTIDHGDRAIGLFGEAGFGRSWERDACLLYRCFARYYQGDLSALVREVSEHIQSSARSGNRFLNVSLRTGLRIRHLIVDSPDIALEDLEDALSEWLPALDSLQVQHWYALWGRCETALYRGEPQHASEELKKQEAALERSLLLRVLRLRCEYLHLAGRIHLALGTGGAAGEKKTAARRARAVAKQLERQRLPMGGHFAVLLRAGAARLLGEEKASVRFLEQAVGQLEATGTHLFAAAARRRLGETRGGDEGQRLVADADSWMKGQGVLRPEKLTRMMVPGWE